MKNEPMEKFLALCDSGKPWYAFLLIYSILLAAAALVELLTEQKIKRSVWALSVAGILNCLANILRCRLLQEKAGSK